MVILILAVMLIFLIGCTSFENENVENNIGNDRVEVVNNEAYLNNELPEKNYTFLAEELYINSEIRVIDLLGLSKDEIMLKLGEGYTITYGIYGEIDGVGYKYSEHGIRFIFGYGDIVRTVIVYEESCINGAKTGMSVGEITCILGEGEILDLGGHTRITHALKYEYGNLALWFSLYPDENGYVETAEIRLWSI